MTIDFYVNWLDEIKHMIFIAGIYGGVELIRNPFTTKWHKFFFSLHNLNKDNLDIYFHCLLTFVTVSLLLLH